MFQPAAQFVHIDLTCIPGCGQRCSGPGGLARNKTAGNNTQGRLNFTVAADTASCNQKIADAKRNKRAERNAVTFTGFIDGSLNNFAYIFLGFRIRG